MIDIPDNSCIFSIWTGHRRYKNYCTFLLICDDFKLKLHCSVLPFNKMSWIWKHNQYFFFTFSVSGACTCLDGYQGKYCDKECDQGYYGHACDNKCKCDKINSERCDRVKGTCFCLPGYQGEICTEVCHSVFCVWK